VKNRGYTRLLIFFMHSLAEARNSRSIGVVLSGTASDGTRGLAAIKAEGGITFAQDEKSAKHFGMPHSAVASGSVDFVLSPDEIGRELARISGHPYLSQIPTSATPPKTREPASKQESFERIFALLRASGGINFQSVHRAQDAITADPAHAWTLEKLADIANTSPRNLARLFQRYARTNPLEYIHRLRVTLAREMLTNSQLDVEQVAMRAWFGSSRQLRRVWSKYHALSPARLRSSGTRSTGNPNGNRRMTAT
jgi:AraC-like DNA-binding protein